MSHSFQTALLSLLFSCSTYFFPWSKPLGSFLLLVTHVIRGEKADFQRAISGIQSGRFVFSPFCIWHLVFLFLDPLSSFFASLFSSFASLPSLGVFLMEEIITPPHFSNSDAPFEISPLPPLLCLLPFHYPQLVNQLSQVPSLPESSVVPLLLTEPLIFPPCCEDLLQFGFPSLYLLLLRFVPTFIEWARTPLPPPLHSPL